jgi:hypothetical protein
VRSRESVFVAFFRPSGALPPSDLPPTAFAVGCILAPLRGWVLAQIPASPKRARRRAVRCAPGICVCSFLSPLRGSAPSHLPSHGFRRGLHSCAASRLGSVANPRFSQAQEKAGGGLEMRPQESVFVALFRPSGALLPSDLPPTAFAVGCILAPLRGWVLAQIPASPKRARRRAIRCAPGICVCCFLSPLRGFAPFRLTIPHGFRRGLHSCAASRLGSSANPRFSQAQEKAGGGLEMRPRESVFVAFFRPSGALPPSDLPPTAFAVGCILAPLRGWYRGRPFQTPGTVTV